MGQSQTHLKDHLIDFFHLPFYFCTFSTPSSLITPISFGEGLGVRLFLSLGEVAGGEAVCFILVYVSILSCQVHRAIRVDLQY